MRIRFRRSDSPSRGEAAEKDTKGPEPKHRPGRVVGHRQFLRMLAGAAGAAGVGQLVLRPRAAEAADGTFDNLTVQGGLLQLTNATSSLVNFGGHGFGVPSAPVGWKVRIWDNGQYDMSYGVGVEAYYAWIHTYTGLKLYAQGNLVMTADNTSGGRLKLGTRVIADTGGCYYA